MRILILGIILYCNMGCNTKNILSQTTYPDCRDTCNFITSLQKSDSSLNNFLRDDALIQSFLDDSNYICIMRYAFFQTKENIFLYKINQNKQLNYLSNKRLIIKDLSNVNFEKKIKAKRLNYVLLCNRMSTDLGSEIYFIKKENKVSTLYINNGRLNDVCQVVPRVPKDLKGILDVLTVIQLHDH